MTAHRRARRGQLILAALLIPASAVHAQDTDLVELASGNRMTGELAELRRGLLTFDIDGAGTVDIDWRNVVRLQCAHDLDIELDSGQRLSGSVRDAGSGRLEVRTATGLRSLDMRTVVRMTPVAATFLERTTGFIDLGLGILSASDARDLTINAEAENRTRNYINHVALSSLLRRRDEQTDQRRNHLELGARRLLARRWFALAQLEAAEDRELDLDSRFLLGGALGRTLLQSQYTAFALYGGLDYVVEDYRGVPGSDDSFEVLASVEWDWFEVGGKTELLSKASTHFSLDRSRTRLELTASLHRDLFRNFYWSLNLFESYDSDPPPGLENSDAGLTLTLGSSF